jgi:hypothetical protein
VAFPGGLHAELVREGWTRGSEGVWTSEMCPLRSVSVTNERTAPPDGGRMGPAVADGILAPGAGEHHETARRCQRNALSPSSTPAAMAVPETVMTDNILNPERGWNDASGPRLHILGPGAGEPILELQPRCGEGELSQLLSELLLAFESTSIVDRPHLNCCGDIHFSSLHQSYPQLEALSTSQPTRSP